MKCDHCKQELPTVRVIREFPPRNLCEQCCADRGIPFEKDSSTDASQD